MTFSGNHCESHVDILQSISCQFQAMITLCEHSYEINTIRSLNSQTFVCYTTQVITILSIYRWILLRIVKMVANLKLHSFFFFISI